MTLDKLLASPAIVACFTGFISIVTLLVSRFLDEYFKTRREKEQAAKAPKNNLYPAIEEAGWVKMVLMELIQEYRPSTISIVQFHNGGQWYSRKGMQRVTMTYEICPKGSGGISVKADTQGVILSGEQLLWLDEVVQKKGVYYPDTSLLPEGEVRDYYEYFQKVSVSVMPLFDQEGHMIGLLTMTSIHKDFLHNLSQAALRMKSQKLETLLTEN